MEFDFSQHTSVPALEKVPADFRSLYKQDGDKYVLDTEDPKVKSSVSAITGLNNALKAARAEAKNKPAALDLTPLKEFGTDVPAIAEAIKTKVATLQDAAKGVNVDKIKQDLATQFSGQLTTEQARNKKLQTQLHKTLVLDRAEAALKAEKGDVELLMPLIEKSVKTVETDDKLLVHVTDVAGDIRYSGVTGAPMSINELVKEIKGNAKYAKYFESEALDGGGADPEASKKKAADSVRQQRTSELTPMQKITKGLNAGAAKRGK